MKRFVSLALVFALLVTGLTGVAEEKKGLFGSIGDGLSDAWNWTKGAADDVAGWTSKAANDAANWTVGAANDAWNWTQSAAGDVADWTSKAAKDATDWTNETTADVLNTVGGIWKKDEKHPCAKCGDTLEEQQSFDSEIEYWKCEKCGYMNAVADETIYDSLEDALAAQENEIEGSENAAKSNNEGIFKLLFILSAVLLACSIVIIICLVRKIRRKK